MSQRSRTKLTPPELARQWGVAPETVIGWIRSGELRAINIASRGAARPRYLIDVADLATFEQRRLAFKAQNEPQPRRRTLKGVVKYF